MKKKTNHLFEFDNFRVDPGQKCLWYGSDLISLTPKAFETLVVLIEHKGNVVDKETLLNRVWENTFVEESTLTQNISTLRKTLNSLESEKQFIETVPRRGYRFLGSVRQITSDEEILVVESLTETEIVSEQEIFYPSNQDKTNPLPDLQRVQKTKTFVQEKRKILSILGAFACLAVFGGILIKFNGLLQPKAVYEEKFLQFEIDELTSAGDISKMAISPDGNFVAFVEKKDGFQTLFLKKTGNPKTTEIIPPIKDEYIGVTFSPDNQYIYYAAYQKMDAVPSYSLGVMYKVPVLGGTRQEMAKDVDSPVAFSPADDKKFAFVRQNPSRRESSIIIFDCGGAGEIKLTSRKWNERFSSEGLSWSPDGKFLVSAAFESKNISNPMGLIVTNTANGDQKSLVSENFNWIGQVSWLKDGSGIAFPVSMEKSPDAAAGEIWLASFPDGKSRRITSSVNGAYGLGATADSNSIALVKSNRESGMWVSSIENIRNASLISNMTGNDSLIRPGMSWTPAGQIVYTSTQTGNSDVWSVNADGTNPVQLTSDLYPDTEPVISMDGKYVFFISNRTNSQNIWRMNLDGKDARQITNVRNVVSYTVSPDGKRIYFTGEDDVNSLPKLQALSIDGGGGDAVEQITDIPVQNPQISPDGKFIVCLAPEKNNSGNIPGKTMITLISVADRKITGQFENPSNKENLNFSWTSDSKSFSYKVTQNGVSNIWLQKIEESAPIQLTNFQTGRIFRFAWSKKDNRIAFEKGVVNNEIILVRNTFRKTS